MKQHRATLPGARADTLVVRERQPTNLAGSREERVGPSTGLARSKVVMIERSWGTIIMEAADEHLLSGWYLTFAGGKNSRHVRVERRIYPTRRSPRETKALASLIMPPPHGMIVDHINGDVFDNRRSNLRFATRQQNAQNTLSRKGASKYKGVSARPGNRWRATITGPDYVFTRLGDFLCEEDAARAYDEAARRLHGDFATLNFPLPGERCALRKPVQSLGGKA